MDIRQFASVLPHVVHFEILTQHSYGVGTRYVETRLMRGKEFVSELEITEYIPHERARIVTENNGTLWDSLFLFEPAENATLTTLQMHARSYKIVPRLMLPLFKSKIREGIDRDLTLAKAHLESVR